MAAALLAMVANLTLGRKRYQAVQDQAERVLAEAETLRRRAQELVSEDVEAYGKVAAALSLPRESEQQKSDRQRSLQQALMAAVAPPLDTMRVASRVALLAKDLVSFGNRSAISDVGVAILSARSGYRAAKLNVEINLGSIRDPSWVAETRASMSRVPDPEIVEPQVMQQIEAVIHGEVG